MQVFKVPLSIKLSQQNCILISILSHTCHLTHSCHITKKTLKTNNCTAILNIWPDYEDLDS
jgi:hypothetical protein